MFPGSYFGARYFAPRYWPKVGADAVAGPADEVTTANAYFRRVVTAADGNFRRTVTAADGNFRRTVTAADTER